MYSISKKALAIWHLVNLLWTCKDNENQEHPPSVGVTSFIQRKGIFALSLQNSVTLAIYNRNEYSVKTFSFIHHHLTRDFSMCVYVVLSSFWISSLWVRLNVLGPEAFKSLKPLLLLSPAQHYGRLRQLCISQAHASQYKPSWGCL